MNLELSTILGFIVTLISGVGVGFLTKSGRVKAKADAYKAMAEAYEYRLKCADERVRICNETEKAHLSRISELNHALDDKTDYIREQVGKTIEAEHETNRVNRLLVAAQEEIGRLKLQVAHFREWRCYWHDCRDERGRKPRQEISHSEDGHDPE